MKTAPLFRTLLSVSVLALALTVPSQAAEVFQVTHETKSALPAGKESDGMIGDWLIRNDRVVAVIGQTSDWRDANQMVEGVQGAVIDFTTLADNNDELVVFYPMGYRPTGVSAIRAEVIHAKGAAAEFKVVRDPTKAEPFRSTTIYTLRDGEAFLRVKTIHENTSDAPVKVAAHDWLRLDNDIACPQPHGDQLVIVMENKWYHAAYGLAGTDGHAQRAAKDLTQKTLREIGAFVHYPTVDPEQKPLSLAPGKKIEIDRLLFVARTTAAVQIAAAKALGRPSPVVELKAVDKNGSPVADAFIEVDRDGVFVTATTSSSDGTVDLPLADGAYALKATQIGRPDLERKLVITAGKLSGDATLLFDPRSEITLDISEAGTGTRIPVKIEFRGKNGGGHPNLGPQKRPNGAGNSFFSAHGQDTFPIPAGTYEVHLSRGPEYEVIVRDCTVPPGGHVELAAKIQREFSTPHWIIADLHNHSTGSGDSGVEFAGRVLNLACAGIEFGPATEHNRISTFTPTIKALGLEKFIASAPSMELSGRPGPGNTNHQIGFPLEIHDDQQGYGAPRTDANPYIQMKRLRDLDHGSPKLMQQNHPDIGWLYFDKDRDGVPDGGYGTRPLTDVMEVRETMLFILDDTAPDAKKRTSRAFNWLQMLNQGDRIYGTANTDAHSVGFQTGSIFNFIHLDHDDIATLDPWAVARAVKAGHVIMSNGPFLDVSINGVLPGDDTTATAGAISVKIKVQQATWSRIDRVQILVNGRQISDGNFTRQKNPGDFGDGVMQFDREVPVKLTRDAHIIVVATGENETIGRLTGGKYAKNHPMAVSNPIYVDVDGNGFQPNKDTLDAPLPDGKPHGKKQADDGE